MRLSPAGPERDRSRDARGARGSVRPHRPPVGSERYPLLPALRLGCLALGLGLVAWAADRLQVMQVVCAALGLGNDVVNLRCRCDAACALAWLAQVQISGECDGSGLRPGGSVSPGVSAASVVLPACHAHPAKGKPATGNRAGVSGKPSPAIMGIVNRIVRFVKTCALGVDAQVEVTR
jgi:hypothetical protein